MEVRAESNQGHEALADRVNDSMGVEESEHSPMADGHEENDNAEGTHSKETLNVQKRLKSQKRAHEREVRELHARIGDLESRMPQHNYQPQQQPIQNYMPPQTGTPIDEHIHKAVSFALQQKDMEERKAHEAQMQQHVHRQYQEFQKHLDHVGDKYDDFHDVVFGRDTPYTPSMRDYALTLPRNGQGSAGEVLYKLGKNPEELNRISKLHPLDQASEMSRLSHALIGGGDQKTSSEPRSLGQIKSNPVNHSRAVTDKTSVGDIRQRMKSGVFK